MLAKLIKMKKMDKIIKLKKLLKIIKLRITKKSNQEMKF